MNPEMQTTTPNLVNGLDVDELTRLIGGVEQDHTTGLLRFRAM